MLDRARFDTESAKPPRSAAPSRAGEVEGLEVSLAGSEDKLAQIDNRSQQVTISLGMPTTRSGDRE